MFVLFVNVFGFLSSTFVDIDHDASARKLVAELVCHPGLSRVSLWFDLREGQLAVF